MRSLIPLLALAWRLLSIAAEEEKPLGAPQDEEEKPPDASQDEAPTASGEGGNEGGPSRVASFREFDWLDSDPVQAYYAEFLLAQWVLDRAPWNAYHSGLAFENTRTGEKVLFDYAPEDTSSVMNMVIPHVRIGEGLQAAVDMLTGDVDLVWRDKAKTQFYKYWPKSYSNMVGLGALNGSAFRVYAAWVESDYAPKFFAFQPVEVAIPGKGTVARSRMCHDFVTDSLWVLYNEGVRFKADDPIFRDHIIMYASSIDQVTDFTATPHGKRQWLRYLRGLWIFLEEIKEQFTHARKALAVAWKLGLPIFLHNEKQDWKVHLVSPFLNYCYLPLALPPDVHDPFGSLKLCALGMTAESNVTAPIPWGTVLAVEERLDRFEAPVALALVIFFAVLCSGRGGAKSGRLLSSETPTTDAQQASTKDS